MTSALDDVWDRLHRADEHFEAIKRSLCSYYRFCAEGVRGYFDPDDAGLVLGPGLVAPEARFHTLVGEFLHDLRSALDHLVSLLVVLNYGSPDHDTTFPVLGVAPTANKKGIHPPPYISGGGVSQDALAVIEEAQPYKWKTDYARHPIYMLHELWNIDKHRHIVAKGSRLDAFVIPNGTPKIDGLGLRVDAVTEDGAEISIVPDAPTVKVDVHTTLRVMIHEPSKKIVDYPLMKALKEIRTATHNIVIQIDEGVIQPMWKAALAHPKSTP